VTIAGEDMRHPVGQQRLSGGLQALALFAKQRSCGELHDHTALDQRQQPIGIVLYFDDSLGVGQHHPIAGYL